MDELKNYPVQVEQALQWGEMDAFNHINNTIYFKYFENTRIKFMDGSGLTETMKIAGEDVGPILAHTEASYRIPLTFPDQIRTCLRVISIGNTSFTVEHIVWSEQFQAVACRGKSVTVLLNYKTEEKVAIPDEMRATLKKFM